MWCVDGGGCKRGGERNIEAFRKNGLLILIINHLGDPKNIRNYVAASYACTSLMVWGKDKIKAKMGYTLRDF